jgi:hypothetical protein
MRSYIALSAGEMETGGRSRTDASSGSSHHVKWDAGASAAAFLLLETTGRAALGVVLLIVTLGFTML